mmetsp:Transcript_2501/g.3778  ORF Transcript_2501/g.3778 Transcript_2501/m.3778 type:complete len:264 (-) Transcript_2501:519-1310(-)|eukprot:CAMPEP_0195528204 /NCGR_PEP_ID=MMETSP0794_2-20130614/30257_1 /TAXON_ID=515487 /ORGANISM="Stephanopyxis turris, Strain CCMP 815" /LENGTH=263 /DNA_ID=CAMNT_0040659295 /DNA_START=208 /DNA_END=999 /DNA_ORIENTATION=+
MNCKEHYLPELELATGQVREALQCLLHTILFIRAPGPVAPRDVHCEDFDITYTRIASVSHTNNTNNSSVTTNTSNPSSRHHRHHNSTGGGANHPNEHHHHSNNNKNNNPNNNLDKDVDCKVDSAIENFLRSSLVQIGPELLQGIFTLSFFERRATKQFFGMVSNEEKVVWEQWILRVVVNTTPRPVNDDYASVIERQRIQDTAENMLKSAMMKIFEIASSGDINHVPPVMYEFEINSTKPRADERENIKSRVTNMPNLINLGS